MQVTVTGGAGNSPATLKYDANDLAAINAQALAATIDTNYQTAIYYNPHHPPITPSAGYLIVSKSVASNTIDARGFGAIVDEDNGRASTIIGGGSDFGQIVLAGDGGLTYSAHTGGATVVAGGGDNAINMARDTSDTAVYTSIGNDTIIAGDGNATISAGAGANLISLGAGADFVTVTGIDTIKLGSGSDTIDVLKGGSAFIKGAASVSGSGYSLVFSNGGLASTIQGGAGSYSISGGAGGGIFKGGSAGDNSIVGGTGAVSITGGGEGDTLLGGSGDDKISAALGNETLGGGGGADLFNLGIHQSAGSGGYGTTDTILDYTNKDLIHVGNISAINYALNTYQVDGNSGSFLLEDGTKVVLQGFTGHLTGNNFG